MHLVQYLTDFRNKVFIRHKNLVLEIAGTSKSKGKEPVLAVCLEWCFLVIHDQCQAARKAQAARTAQAARKAQAAHIACAIRF